MQKIKLAYFLQLLAIISLLQLADSKIARQDGNSTVQDQKQAEQPLIKVQSGFTRNQNNIWKQQNRGGRRQTLSLTDSQAEELLGDKPENTFSFVKSQNGTIRRRGNSDSSVGNYRLKDKTGRESSKAEVKQNSNKNDSPKRMVQFSDGIVITGPKPLYLPGMRPKSRTGKQRTRCSSAGSLTVEAILGMGAPKELSQQHPDSKPIIREQHLRGQSENKKDENKQDLGSKSSGMNKNEDQKDGKTNERPQLLFQQKPRKRYQSCATVQEEDDNPTVLFQQKAVGLFVKGFNILTEILALAEYDGASYSWQVGHSGPHFMGPVNPINNQKRKSEKQKQIVYFLNKLRNSIGGKINDLFLQVGRLRKNDLRIPQGENEILSLLTRAVHTLRKLVKVFTTGPISCQTLTHYFPKVYTAGRQTSRLIGVLTQWRVEGRDQKEQSQTNLRMMRLLTTCLDVEGQIYSIAMQKIITSTKFTKLDQGYLKKSKDRVVKYLQFGSQGNQYFKLIKGQVRFHHFIDSLKKAQTATIRLMVYGIKHMDTCGLDSELAQ